MKTVQVITTGGTIEKAYSEQSGKVLNTTSKIAQSLELLRLPDCDVRVIPLMNKDSLEMSAEDRARLVAEVGQLLARSVAHRHHSRHRYHGRERLGHREGFSRAASSDYSDRRHDVRWDLRSSDGLQNLTESLFAARVAFAGQSTS